jgi:protein-export membrane protein SecD
MIKTDEDPPRASSAGRRSARTRIPRRGDSLAFRLLVIVGLALLSGWVLATRGITRGLDLQGGTYLALEVRDPAGALDPDQKEEAIDRALTVIRTRLDELGVAEPGIQKSGRHRIEVELPGAAPEEQQRARAVIARAAFLQFQIVRPTADLADALPRIDRVATSLSGASDPAGGGDPGRTAPADPELFATPPRPFSDRLLPSTLGPEGVYYVAEDDVEAIERYLALPEVRDALPRDAVLRWGVPETSTLPGHWMLYLLQAQNLITGDHLVDAQAMRDPQTGHPIVTFEFSRQGGRIFENGTGRNVGELMAIVLDERVVSAPIILEPIGGRGRIEMSGGTLLEARDLALVLRAGALPVPLEIVSEGSIGPSLGQDSIDRGQVAGAIGLGLVVLIMLLYYRFAGVLAVTALALYVLFVLAGLAAVGAALTLPGIAGLILSVGMAVDANVLIFERIREELEAGRTPRMAVRDGFGNALSAILDAQITTLLTALVLFHFGTGPVRGFAVTLGIGLVASMFTAVYVTRTFFTLYLSRAGTKGVSI